MPNSKPLPILPADSTVPVEQPDAAALPTDAISTDTPISAPDAPIQATQATQAIENFQCGAVSIIGEPNAGKSTLLNTLLGEKLSIVTAKPQTTRKKVLGIYSDARCQIIFLDTPGVMKPKYKLHRAMLDAVNAARDEADVLLLLLDVKAFLAKAQPLEEDFAFAKVKGSTKPVLLVLNKIDLIRVEQLLPLIDSVSKQFEFKEIIPVSALKGFGKGELIKSILPYLPVAPAQYPADQLSTATERFFVSEFIREKIFELYTDEIPYSTEVEIEEFREQVEAGAGKKDFIRCAIVVERETQKSILIGKGGAALKRVGSKARFEIEKFLGRPVFLDLFVKVREGWREKDSDLKNFGY